MEGPQNPEKTEKTRLGGRARKGGGRKGGRVEADPKSKNWLGRWWSKFSCTSGPEFLSPALFLSILWLITIFNNKYYEACPPSPPYSDAIVIWFKWNVSDYLKIFKLHVFPLYPYEIVSILIIISYVMRQDKANGGRQAGKMLFEIEYLCCYSYCSFLFRRYKNLSNIQHLKQKTVTNPPSNYTGEE